MQDGIYFFFKESERVDRVLHLFSVKQSNLGNERGTYQERYPPLTMRWLLLRICFCVYSLLQFLITGFNCWQVGKSSVTCNA